MKKINLLCCFLLVASLFFTSCNRYVSMNNATKMSQLKGNPFKYYLAKAVLKNLANYIVTAGIKDVGKLNLLTSISSIFKSNEEVAGLKKLLNVAYQIPNNKINKQFSSLSTVKDLIGFIGNNGKGFNFYSKNSSL